MSPIEGLSYKGLPPQLKGGFDFMCFNVLWTFIAGELTGNYSQVDRVWTLLPPLYTMWYTFYPLLDSAPLEVQKQGVQPRAVLMSFLQVLWSARLSYHANRRGFFSWSSEDYRWIVFRDAIPKLPIVKYFPKVFMTVYNLVFICIMQNIILALLGLPAYSASVSTEPLNWPDALLAGLVLTFIALEFISDNQQYAFQTFKQTKTLDKNEWPGSRIAFTDTDAQRGFVTRGLWAYSRHPNCACEQSIWFYQSLFPFLAHPKLLTNPNLVDFLFVLTPSLVLSSLFIGSTLFTESISQKKYPAYQEYKKRVGMFWPSDTWVKGVWLMLWKEKASVERIIWGSGMKKME